MKYIDYGTMQSDAQQRVLEMQRRAHNAVCSQAPRPLPVPIVQPSEDVSPLPESEKHRPHGANNPSEAISALARDPEKTLIIALLVLLVAEKADSLLIIALLYLLV